jgi:single-strand DNA-binding protein
MNFTVAHTEKFKDAQGVQKERTVWVDCAYWSEKTGIAPYLKKGTQVFVEGAPDLRTYTKTDGTFGATIALRVLGVQLLGSKPSDNSGSADSGQGGSYANQPESSSMTNEVPEAADDLPF